MDAFDLGRMMIRPSKTRDSYRGFSWSLRPILRRMRLRPIVFKDLAEITAIDPAAASGTVDEVVGFVFRWGAHEIADIFSARDIGHSEAVNEGAIRRPESSRSTGLRDGPGHKPGIVLKCRSRDRWWARQTKPVRSRLSWDIDRLQKP